MIENIGELENFNVQCFLDCAHELIRADEVERALLVLNNVPAYYRDFPPKQVTELKNLITSRIATPAWYAKYESSNDLRNIDYNFMKNSVRGILLMKEIRSLNDNDLCPYIVDYGPGEFWLPQVLFDEGDFFNYKPLTICKKASDLFFEEFPHFRGDPNPDDPSVFVACEIIEHIWNPVEVKSNMLASCGLADVIHISTPKYTIDGRDQLHNGEKVRETLGHLRAYTPNEFVNLINQIFPEYSWRFFDSQIMHMRLLRKDSKYLDQLMNSDLGV